MEKIASEMIAQLGVTGAVLVMLGFLIYRLEKTFKNTFAAHEAERKQWLEQQQENTEALVEIKTILREQKK